MVVPASSSYGSLSGTQPTVNLGNQSVSALAGIMLRAVSGSASIIDPETITRSVAASQAAGRAATLRTAAQATATPAAAFGGAELLKKAGIYGGTAQSPEFLQQREKLNAQSRAQRIRTFMLYSEQGVNPQLVDRGNNTLSVAKPGSAGFRKNPDPELQRQKRQAVIDEMKQILNDARYDELEGYKNLRNEIKKWFEQSKKSQVRGYEAFKNINLEPIPESLPKIPRVTAPRIRIPGRAKGGPVSSGDPYIVGEKGPELFVP